MGGCHTTLVKRCEPYRRIAERIADDTDPHGLACILCGEAPGTRWHALFACQLAKPGEPDRVSGLRERMYAFAEARLETLGFSNEVPFDPPSARTLLLPAHAARYPRLSHAGWLLPTLTSQDEPSEDLDLASRAAVPEALVQAVLHALVPPPPLQVWCYQSELFHGRYVPAGSLNGRVPFQKDSCATIRHEHSRWALVASRDSAALFVSASGGTRPPLGRWEAAAGAGSCRVSTVPRADCEMPRGRCGEASGESQARRAALVKRKEAFFEMLSGVVLHLALLRHRAIFSCPRPAQGHVPGSACRVRPPCGSSSSPQAVLWPDLLSGTGCRPGERLRRWLICRVRGVSSRYTAARSCCISAPAPWSARFSVSTRSTAPCRSTLQTLRQYLASSSPEGRSAGTHGRIARTCSGWSSASGLRRPLPIPWAPARGAAGCSSAPRQARWPEHLLRLNISPTDLCWMCSGLL